MSTEEKIMSLFLDGVKGGEISRQVGVSRQVVSYHLTDKSKRRCTVMGEAKRERVNALAREAYARRLAELRGSEP